MGQATGRLKPDTRFNMTATTPARPERNPLPLRFMVYHLHRVSARLRYLQMPHGQLCLPAPLPRLSELLDERPPLDKLAIHPGVWFSRACEQMQLPADRLAIEAGFRLWIDTPGQATPVYLLRVEGPSPFEAPPGCRWIELPDCFAMLPIERLLMQAIYRFLLE